MRMGSFTLATVVSPPRFFSTVRFEEVTNRQDSLALSQERTRSARDFGSSWAMHKFARFGRTSDRGTPIHPYRTTHITHTHGDLLGSTSLPRLFSHSYGLPGLRSIVFLFYLFIYFSIIFFQHIPIRREWEFSGLTVRWTGRGLDWTDGYIYIKTSQYDLASRHMSNEGLPTWSRAVWVLYSGVCTAFLDFLSLDFLSLDFRLSPVSYVVL
jgi:hypothetical protein